MDSFIQAVRPDSTPCEPGIFSPISDMDDSPRVFSSKRESDKIDVQDVLDTLQNFNSETWFFLLFCSLLCSALFRYIDRALSRPRLSPHDVVEGFVTSFWNYFQLFVDVAPSTVSTFMSASVLWTSICVAMFYGSHLVLMSTLSTDLMVPFIPRSIESLSDLLYDPEFHETKPVISRQMNMLSVLKQSPPGTDARVLLDRIMQDERTSIRTVDMKNGGSVIQQLGNGFEEAVQGRIAIIENSGIITQYAKCMACYMNPELTSKMYPAKDIILQSASVTLFSKQTPLQVRRLVQHKVTLAAEAGLFQQLFKHLSMIVKESMNILKSTEGMICVEKFDKVFFATLDLDWKALPMDPFWRLTFISLGIILIALIVLLIENAQFILSRRRIYPRIRVVNIHKKVHPSTEEVTRPTTC